MVMWGCIYLLSVLATVFRMPNTAVCRVSYMNLG